MSQQKKEKEDSDFSIESNNQSSEIEDSDNKNILKDTNH